MLAQWLSLMALGQVVKGQCLTRDLERLKGLPEVLMVTCLLGD